MKIFNLWVLVIFINSASFSQESKLSGYVYNSDTGQRIYGAHIYWKCSTTQGTISNEDGIFLIPTLRGCNSMVVSHIGYNTVQYDISNNNDIAIGMTASSYELSEITVSAMDVNFIINSVISNLEENHPNFTVNYYFYHREVYFSKDSTIHFMEEHTGVVEHKVASLKKLDNNVVLYKSRIGYFSNKGKDMYANHRLVSFSQILWDNPVYVRYDHLQKRRSKHFEYKLVGKESISGRQCFVVDFKTDKSTTFTKGRLYIETESFAIVKEELSNNSRSEIREISFVESDGKWFLNNVIQYKSRLNGLSYRTTLYNVSNDKEFEHNFSSIGRLLPNFVKEKATDFNDNYWEDYNSIPLPNWILKRIKNNSR